ncbi:hypothetical protein A3G62_01035 [Candidatus Kaiserbacteria bacterium RIFCSPLOWO2_12_FULL_50_10]|nr:MAG: hypothetical protein A3G62_01035 [Candidatus Kaiserbacteria bacterium RIFCSPLOWO2_12_FULL_50_10]
MAGTTKRAGGKYAKSHSTMIPAAALICKALERLPEVTRISLGFITAGMRTVATRRIKIVTANDAALKLSIRDHISHQEIYVYLGTALDKDSAIQALKKIATREHMAVNGEI